MTVEPWQRMGGASERVCGSCICVQITWQIFFLPPLCLSFQQISSSGCKEASLLSWNTVRAVYCGWVWGGCGWVWGRQWSSLTGKPCSDIFNSWDTTWLMVFLDPPVPRKPRTELVSNNLVSTKCTEIIHAACIMSRWSYYWNKKTVQKCQIALECTDGNPNSSCKLHGRRWTDIPLLRFYKIRYAMHTEI